MLVARSGFDWEGSRLRASEGAGVSRRLRTSERWNLHKERNGDRLREVEGREVVAGESQDLASWSRHGPLDSR